MSKSKQALTNHLVAAVVPHLGTEAEGGQPPKAVAKALRKLAKQLLKKQRKAKKPLAPPAAPTAKRVRKALAGELANTLQPYLNPGENAAEDTPKAITKTIKRLASELMKQRRKQAKQTAKAKQPATTARPDDALLAASATKPQASRPTLAAPARRPTPPKRGASKAVPTSVAAAAPAEGSSQE
jgi:ribosome-associated translation inhibitor RaiA